MGYVLYCPECGKYTGDVNSPVCADCHRKRELARVELVAEKIAKQTSSTLMDVQITDKGYEIQWLAENDRLNVGCGLSFGEAADNVDLAITLMYWFYQSIQLWHMVERGEV